MLIHQLPPEPAYVRVKIRRRLQKLGATPLKNSVYLLSESEEHLEDFQWLAQEIEAEGGEATICVAEIISGAGAVEAEPKPEDATWVTRQGVFVDRIASAWLIRRFIDPGARFRFVPATGYKPKPGELRFDMYRGEYGHEGDRCTFETLLHRFGIRDRRLGEIAQIVHDIDCKDGKFGRPEAEGVAAALREIKAATDDDDERIAQGARVFEGLYLAGSGYERK